MGNRWNRRGFLKASGGIGLGMGLGWAGLESAVIRPLLAAEATHGTPNTAKLGWRLACAAWSFNKLSFGETVGVISDLGLDCMVGFAGQPLSKENPKVRLGHEMSAADRQETKKRLADKGVKLVGCYCGFPQGDAARKVFDWAKEMELDFFDSEPPVDAYESLDRLCQEYKIKLAIHNHPKPNPNWNPEVVMKHLEGRSPWVGACCDTGHWIRSGLDPVAMLKKVQGRLMTFDLKDIATAGLVTSPCVPYGTGQGNIEGILAEAKRQGFRGVVSIEFEPYSAESRARVAECIANFEKMAAKLAKPA